MTIDLDRSHSGRLLRIGLVPQTIEIRGTILPPLDLNICINRLDWAIP